MHHHTRSATVSAMARAGDRAHEDVRQNILRERDESDVDIVPPARIARESPPLAFAAIVEGILDHGRHAESFEQRSIRNHTSSPTRSQGSISQ